MKFHSLHLYKDVPVATTVTSAVVKSIAVGSIAYTFSYLASSLCSDMSNSSNFINSVTSESATKSIIAIFLIT